MTTENSTTNSKKHASIGGAVVGSMVAGPIGAVAGGVGLGKTTGSTKGSSVSNQILTCLHLGVKIDFDGFINEVVLINSQVDQGSSEYARASEDAQNIVNLMGQLAKTPVPETFLPVEEHDSLNDVNIQLERIEKELKIAMQDEARFILPTKYRTREQIELSDEEYLSFLAEKDAERIRTEKCNKNSTTVIEKKEKERMVNEDKPDSSKRNKVQSKILNVIYSFIFWGLSVFIYVLSLSSFFSSDRLSTGIVLFLVATLINPLFGNTVRKKYTYPKWIVLIEIVIGFIVFFITIS